MTRWSHLHRSVNAWGLVVAALGFFLTRFTVTLVVSDDPLRFFLVGLVPLTLGLSVATFGVILAVGAFEPAYARTTAVWTLIGAATMAVLVVLTLYGTDPENLTDVATLRSKTYLANFLIGGCFGGMLTGVYAARNRRERREQKALAKRMVVLNRVLRDSVLNSITAIQGHLDLLDDDDEAVRERGVSVVRDHSGTLAETVDDVRHLTNGSGSSVAGLEAVDVAALVRDCAETASGRYPGAEVVVEDVPAELEVWADEMLEHVLELLIENGIEHNDAETPRVEVAVRRDGPVARLTVVDDGPGLPVEQQAMLDHGSVADYDDPFSGFGLNVASLLVESYRGQIESHVLDGGTRIDVKLRVADGDARVPDAALSSVRSLGASRSAVALGTVAAIAAGLLMGVTMSALAGMMPVIGTLYGPPDPVVGWITHEFHSVVFGIVFVGLLSVVPSPYSTTHAGRVLVGVAWGLYLWFVAAGFVMPLWMLLLGHQATVPNLTPVSFLAHVVWGASLGGLYSLGTEALADRDVSDYAELPARIRF